MKRNMESYSLADVPSIGIDRSRFKSGWTHTTTFNQGELVPICCKEVLPGSTWSVDQSSLIRMATPVFPVMDNAVCDVWWFFVPNRLLWSHWKEFVGENTSSAWAPKVEYHVPKLKFDHQNGAYDYSVSPGSLANHLYGGIGILAGNEFAVSDLPNRAYRLIWNDFFRSEPYQDPVFVPLDDSDRSYLSTVDDSSYGHTLLRVNRLPDYFSVLLPGPQSGPAVTIPIGGVVDISTSSYDMNTSGLPPLHLRTTVNSVPQDGLLGSHSGVVQNAESETPTWKNGVVPSNLVADLTKLEDFGDSSRGTISELRAAFQIQKWLEALNRSGRRYREVLQGLFNVNIPDLTVQVPEYLGGTRFDININQVVQTSSTDQTSPQGNVSAYSMTVNRDHVFKKSFLEHGWIIGLAAVRVRHSYVQGVQRQFTRFDLLDHYFPQFANVSEQPVFGYERFVSGATGTFGPDVPVTGFDKDIIGYKEPWSEYRYDLNTVSGAFTPNRQGASLLQSWTFADYLELFGESNPNPLIDADFMQEPDTNVAQTIAVPSEPQFIANFYFSVDRVLPMPVHSIPGLADHH